MSKAKIKVERNVVGEFVANGKSWGIGLNLILIAGAVARAEPLASIEAPDGDYELRYLFGGKQRYCAYEWRGAT
jgi:hypothetical protein